MFAIGVEHPYLVGLLPSSGRAFKKSPIEFCVEFVQNGGGIVSIFISVSPLDRPRSALSLYYECFTNAFQCLYGLCKRLRTLYHVTDSYENRQQITVFATFAENLPIFVRRWGICERSEFVTIAYEDMANIAKFERLSNNIMSFHQHIRKPIRRVSAA